MTKNVYIVYYSKTGNTKKIAEQIQESFSKVKDAADIEISLMDATNLDLDALKAAAGYIIGTPNYFSLSAGYVKIFFDELFMERSTLKGRPVFCYVSHGGSGYIDSLKSMSDWLELKTVGTPIAINGNSISSSDISTIEANIQEMLKIL